MDVNDLKGLNVEVKKRMDATIEHVRKELSGLRSGRATVAILDPVHVEAYGTMVPLNQVASLSVPEPTLIVAQPFDPSLMKAVEHGISKANLGLNPATQGDLIRVPMPALTEERRRELTKVVKSEGETAKIAVRNLRRDANEQLKKLVKDKEISEDDERRASDDVQKFTDKFVAEIDKLVQSKEAEIMTV